MNKTLLLLAAILCLCCSSCKKEKVAIAGSGWQEIAIIEKKYGKIEWRHELEKDFECNDIEITPDGNILFAYSKGARLINRNHEIIWDYKAEENEEIHSATRMSNGGYMIGVCGDPARIVELDNNGTVTKEIPFITLIFNSHRQFRQVAKTGDGNYLVPLIEKRKLLLLSPEGNLIRNFNIGMNLFSVKELKNNNFLVSCGNNGSFVEIDPKIEGDNNMVITNQSKIGVLLFVAEIFPYKNGNKLIANSNIFSDNKSNPLLIEINKKNEVVWSLPFNKEIKNITAIHSFFE